MGGRPMHVSEADALAFFLRSFSSNQATNKFQSFNHWGAGNRTSEVCECLAAAKFAVVPLHMDRPNTLIRVHFELENSNSILIKQTSCSFPKGSTSLLLPYFPETINHPSICLLSWPSFHLRPANRVLISKVLGYKQYFGREYDEQLLLGSKNLLDGSFNHSIAFRKLDRTKVEFKGQSTIHLVKHAFCSLGQGANCFPHSTRFLFFPF